MRNEQLEWELAIVTQSRNVGDVLDVDVSIEQWLNSVHDGFGPIFAPGFRHQSIDDLQDIKRTPISMENLIQWHPNVNPDAIEELSEALAGVSFNFKGGSSVPVEEDGGLFKVDVMSANSRDHGLSVGNDADDMRPPQQIVRLLFGDAPFFWRTLTLLQAEQQMRFEKFHPEDFQEINWKAWASTRFKAWIEHTDNKIFRHHYENGCSPGERDALYGTMMEPFEIFDSINDWDIPDGEVSCYTYVSILGQGVMIPFFTLFIFLPVLLSTYFSLSFSPSSTTSSSYSYLSPLLPYPIPHHLCSLGSLPLVLLFSLLSPPLLPRLPLPLPPLLLNPLYLLRAIGTENFLGFCFELNTVSEVDSIIHFIDVHDYLI